MKIVVLTSNAYHACLIPFAHYWNRFAGAQRTVIVGCYDAPLPDLPENFEPLRIGRQDGYTFSGGLRLLVSLLNDPYVLLVLEDYFLTADVDWKRIDLACERMLAHRRIAKFDLSDDRLKAPHHGDGTAQGVILSDDDAPYQTSLQAAIWRTDFLWRYLSVDEDAWAFEKYGTKRLIEARRSGASWDIVAGFSDPPLRYANAVGGMGNKPGVIEPKHMPDWQWRECVERGWAGDHG